MATDFLNPSTQGEAVGLCVYDQPGRGKLSQG